MSTVGTQFFDSIGAYNVSDIGRVYSIIIKTAKTRYAELLNTVPSGKWYLICVIEIEDSTTR